MYIVFPGNWETSTNIYQLLLHYLEILDWKTGTIDCDVSSMLFFSTLVKYKCQHQLINFPPFTTLKLGVEDLFGETKTYPVIS